MWDQLKWHSHKLVRKVLLYSPMKIPKYSVPKGNRKTWINFVHAVKYLSIGADRSEQTVVTQIRLLHEEQSDQSLHCLPSNLYLLDAWAAL